jgi:para-nitrobenzyl esterase
MHRRLTLALVGLLLGGCRHASDVRTPDPASIRTARSGDVEGFVGRYGSFVWMGIPYAAPPTGPRRWRAPSPPAPWTGVRPALETGSPCVQYASPLGGVQTAAVNTPVGSEDCLYLNVYAPRAATRDARLPVMLWIHGGGNSIGLADAYDGGNLAASENVIVVTTNYRLGPFGWFRHAALRGDGTTDLERSGNFAILDLVRALEWVRDDIAAFGGDPSRVTVFGESAGAANTLMLLLAPQAHGLFQRAIVESGGLRVTDPLEAEAFTDDAGRGAPDSSSEVIARLLVRNGRATDRADAKRKLATMSADEIASLLRGTSAFDLLRTYTPLPGMGMIPMPMVFTEGTVLPREAPLARFARWDGWNRVPVLVGTNHDESKTFMFGSPVWVRRWFWVVPRLRDPLRYDATAEVMSKMWKVQGADEIATAMVSSGAKDVYVYRFDWKEEPTLAGADLSEMIGAGHGFEIPFVFGHFDLGREANRLFTTDNEPGRRELSGAMMSYWTAFATNGRPARGRRDELPEWQAWSTAPRYLVLDTKAGGGVRPSDELATRSGVLASIDSDPRLVTPRDRCLVYHDLARWTDVMPRTAYDAKCPDYAFDAYPWSG